MFDIVSLFPAAFDRVSLSRQSDDNAEKGTATVTFTPDIPTEGDYDIVFIYVPHPNRASNVPVMVSAVSAPTHTTNEVTRKVDERRTDTDGFVSLGKFHLAQGRATSVTVSNRGTDGYVVADGVQFIPVP